MPLLPPRRNGQTDQPLGRKSRAYRDAFENYLRYGTPIPSFEVMPGVEAKADDTDPERTTAQYVWRTQGDNRVRPSHQANDGKIFSWAEPPPTGHPGEDYGCRCWAEPYVEGNEFFDLELQDVSDEGPGWTDADWVEHYFLGQGATVTLRETGHLSAVVEEYHGEVIDDPKRLPGQIADEARKNVGDHFFYGFGKPYPMRHIVFALGDTVIEGEFEGTCELKGGLLAIEGDIEFRLRDIFRDPLNLEEYQEILKGFIDNYIAEAIDSGIARVEQVISYVAGKIGEVDQALRDYIYDRALRELLRRSGKAAPMLAGKAYPELPGGTPYDIVDDWSASLSAKVFLDDTKSQFTQ